HPDTGLHGVIADLELALGDNALALTFQARQAERRSARRGDIEAHSTLTRIATIQRRSRARRTVGFRRSAPAILGLVVSGHLQRSIRSDTRLERAAVQLVGTHVETVKRPTRRV